MADFRPGVPGMPNWFQVGRTNLGERIPKLMLKVGELGEIKLWGKSRSGADLVVRDLDVVKVDATTPDVEDGLIIILRVVAKKPGSGTLTAFDADDDTPQAHLDVEVLDAAGDPAPKPVTQPAANDTEGDSECLIVRSPDFATVSTGAKVLYSLVEVKEQVPHPSERTPTWFVCYEAGSGSNWFEKLIDADTGGQRRAGNGLSCVLEWNRPGVHTIVCRLAGPKE